MKDYQKEFIQFCIAQNVLKFGSFTLKSGRTSPYFFNAGLFHSGSTLSQLGKFYASTLNDHASLFQYTTLFGPAYKGIPLVCATAISLSTLFNKDTPFAFNRKEKKDHGEGGNIVGKDLKGEKVVIVDDVITAGTAIREAMEILKNAGAICVGVVVAVDRQEKGTGELSAIQEVEKSFAVPVRAIVTLDMIIEFLEGNEQYKDALVSVRAYREQFAARASS
ncbi:orotate phosphoribosyltransferase [Paraphysoderma sedebokerense]|nr:orotate phosphoribosyltransferase [Paraphysoderma sedebokerense]